MSRNRFSLRGQLKFNIPILFVLLLAGGPVRGAITRGQIDDFHDGSTTSGWTNGTAQIR